MGGYADEDLQRISSGQAQALFPPLRAPLGVMHDRLAARVDGRRMARALRLAAAGLGADIREADVRRITRTAGAQPAARKRVAKPIVPAA